MELDLSKSLEENLKKNNVQVPSVGARRHRRKRGGTKEEEEAAAAAAAAPAVEPDREIARTGAKYAIAKVLTVASDVLKKGGAAITMAAVAGAVVWAIDDSFRADLCDPFIKSLASTASVIPLAGIYSAKCDAAMTAYNTAMSTTVLAVAPLLYKAVKTAGTIFVPEEVVEEVTDELIETAKNPAVVAAKAFETRKKVKTGAIADAPATATATAKSRWGKGGKRHTKKRAAKKRVTRRRAIFAY